MAQPNDNAPSRAKQLSPFDIPVETLSKHLTQIPEAIEEYGRATTPNDQTTTLQKISTASKALTASSEPIPQRFLEFTVRPFLNAAVRIACEKDSFNALPQDGSAITVTKLAETCHAEDEFVLRIAPSMAAECLIFETTSSDGGGGLSYRHAPFSQFAKQASPTARVKHQFDKMLDGYTHSAWCYWKEFGLNSPDAKNSPLTLANGRRDQSLFDILQGMPKRAKMMDEAFSIGADLGLRAYGSVSFQ